MSLFANLPLIIGAVLCFSLIVLAHELGHFWAALWHKIPVEEFAMGMGPLLFSRVRGGIRYSLRLFPVGAFVRLVGDEDSKDEEAKMVYQEIPVGRRMAMTLAGPLFNFVVAVILLTGIGMVSGIASDQPIIGEVRPGSIAEGAGLEDGDKIIAIDGTPLQSWNDAVHHINAAPDREIILEVQRQNEKLEIKATPERSASDGLGRIGISAIIQRFDLFNSVRLGISNTGNAITLFYRSIAGAIRAKQAPDLMGPVGIIQITGEVAKNGVADLLWFMAFISINLGVVNLLPVPPLDGAKLLIMALEKVRGKPLNPEREGMIHTVGFVCLLGLIALVTFGDLWRIFSP